MVLNIAQQLIENDFTPLIKNAGEDIFCGGKQVGTCIYCIIAIDAENTQYKEKFEKLSAFIASSYSKPNFNIVVVGLFVIKNEITAELKEFATANVETFEQFNVIKWVISPNGIEIFGKQPDRLLNLKQIIAMAMNNTSSAKSVEEMVQITKEQRQKMIVTKNIWLTFTMIGVLVVIYCLQMLDKQGFMTEYGSMISPIYNNVKWYRCFTSMFLHSGVDHIMANCLSLYIFGSRVERYYGKSWLLGIFLISGVLAAAVSGLFLDPYTYALGASGAIYGLMGAVLCYGLRTKKRVDGFDLYFLITFALIGLAAGCLMPNVDNTAHIAGFIFGMLLGRVKKIAKS